MTDPELILVGAILVLILGSGGGGTWRPSGRSMTLPPPSPAEPKWEKG